MEPPVSDTRSYLQALRQALAGSDPALIQDALAEAETRIRRELQRLSWAEPLLSPQEALERVFLLLGPPEALAERARDRERTVAEALGPLPAESGPGRESPAAEGSRPWPSLFGVLAEPKAYTSLIYLIMAMPLGIFYFTWAVTGLSLSMGLLILVIGVPMLVLFLGSVRALGLGEGRLVEALLDVRMPRRPPLLPEGRTWIERLAGLFSDGYTWKCLAYLLLQLPLGILYFTFAITALSLSLGFILGPVVAWSCQLPLFVIEGIDFTPPGYLAALLPLAGILGLLATLHAALGLGRLQGALARTMLVRK
jgi:hypothetical protein